MRGIGSVGGCVPEQAQMMEIFLPYGEKGCESIMTPKHMVALDGEDA